MQWQWTHSKQMGPKWISTVGPSKTPTLLVTSDGDWFSGGLKWQLDRSVVQNPCDQLVGDCEWFVSVCFYSCQAELTIQFSLLSFPWKKKHTYIFVGETNFLTSISFHHLHCFLEKIHPKRFIIIESFQLLQGMNGWSPTSPLQTAGTRGELTLRMRLTLEVAETTDETLKKKIRKGDGWLIGMKPDGWLYQTNGWNWCFSVSFFGDGWFGWLVGWCDSLIQKTSSRVGKKKANTTGKRVGCGRFWNGKIRSRYILSSKQI